jgi:hypothetical protein
MAAWFAENGRVIDWTIHDLQSLRDVETAEWTFHYTWRGEEQSFDGCNPSQSCTRAVSPICASIPQPLRSMIGEKNGAVEANLRQRGQRPAPDQRRPVAFLASFRPAPTGCGRLSY